MVTNRAAPISVKRDGVSISSVLGADEVSEVYFAEPGDVITLNGGNLKAEPTYSGSLLVYTEETSTEECEYGTTFTYTVTDGDKLIYIPIEES